MIKKILQSFTVLYIEDDKNASEEVSFFLEPIVKELYVAYNGKEGYQAYVEHNPDIIISDIQMPIMNGIEMIKKIRLIDTEIPILITTAYNETSYLLDAIEEGVEGYLFKPLVLSKLSDKLSELALNLLHHQTNYLFFDSAKDILNTNQVDTDTIKLQEELLKQKNFADSIIDTVDSILTVINADGVMIRLNKYAQEFTGYSQEEVASEPYFWSRLLPLEVQPKVLQIIEKARNKEIVEKFENAWISKDGEVRLFSWSNALVLDTTGELDYIVSIGIDITQERLIQEQLLKKQRQLEISSEVSGIAFWELDFKTSTFTFNDQYYKFLATTEEAESGYEMSVERYLQEIIPPSSHQAISDAINEGMSKTSEYSGSFEYQMRRRDGKILDVLVNHYMIYDENGQLDKSYGTKIDLTKRKKEERELLELKEKFETMFNVTNNGIALIDFEGNFLMTNKAYTDMTRFTQEELLTKSCIELTHPDDIAQVKILLTKLIDGESIENFEKRCIMADSAISYVNISMSLIPNQQYILLNLVDITQTKLNEQKLKKYKELMDRNIISSSTDPYGVITYVSSAFCEISGYTKNELIGKKHSIIRSEKVPSSIYKALWDALLSGNSWNGELQNRAKDGSYYWVKISIFPKFDDHGKIVGYDAIHHDISDKKRIEKLSITDELTMLYNRRYFNTVLEKELNRSKRDNYLIALLMIDVDHFKLYNDTYGHQEGDIVLQKIGEVLQRFTKRGGDYGFRLGGEEFGILLTSVDTETLPLYTQSLLDAIEALAIEHKHSNTSKYVTISVGVAYGNMVDSDSSDKLYKRADDLLYKAKLSGRNHIEFSD